MGNKQSQNLDYDIVICGKEYKNIKAYNVREAFEIAQKLYDKTLKKRSKK